MSRVHTNRHLGRITVTGLLGELESVAAALSTSQRADALTKLLANLKSQTSIPFRQHMSKSEIYMAAKNALESAQHP